MGMNPISQIKKKNSKKKKYKKNSLGLKFVPNRGSRVQTFSDDNENVL